MNIRFERPSDHPVTEAIHEAAFGGSPEAEVVRSIHQSGDTAVVSLVAEEGDQIVGHVVFSHVGLECPEGPIRPVVILAPLAVHPRHQGRGFGSALVRRGIDELDHRSEPIVIVRGDARYYGRFGFQHSVKLGIVPPFEIPEDHFLAKPLGTYDPSYRGVVRYPAAFASVGYRIEWRRSSLQKI